MKKVKHILFHKSRSRKPPLTPSIPVKTQRSSSAPPRFQPQLEPPPPLPPLPPSSPPPPPPPPRVARSERKLKKYRQARDEFEKTVHPLANDDGRTYEPCHRRGSPQKSPKTEVLVMPRVSRTPPKVPPRFLPPEPDMPDATYEEWYGDAYVGAPIRYIYPSGYQSMRPRSGPWRISLVVFGLFTWLTIFIVGHCSEKAENGEYDEYDDDSYWSLKNGWCGSTMLYTMWLLSVLITSISMAYCCIVGYIKVRDFAVANCRSQPPGMVGKSDYYVNIDDAIKEDLEQARRKWREGRSAGEGKTIYQADGNPQFWGGHIYRPTQAAVAVTSR